MSGGTKKIIFVVAAILFVCSLYPRKYLTAPQWRVQVVDMQGKPLSGVTVYETWQNYSVEENSHEQKLITDSAGLAEFPARQASSSTLRRIWFTLKAARALIHASFGSFVFVHAIAPGFQEHTYADMWAGSPAEMHSRIVMQPR